MEIIELILDEENEEMVGIEAVSIVSAPAIEESFVALSSDEIKLAKIDDEKRIVMGCALVPNRMIFRKRNDTMFYVYFSKVTIRRSRELFFQNGNQSNATLEHQMKANGLTVVESWIVEDEAKDKSAIYNLNAPVGSWVISMKVEDDELWNEIKEGKKYTGFSIEGFFSDRAQIKKPDAKSEMAAIEEEEAEYMLSNIKNILSNENVELESYNDYPDAVSNNAKRGRELNEKVNNKCATNTGKIRSADLSAKRKLTVPTIKRMYSYLSRAETYYDPSDTKACGTISYLLWGGKAGLSWSRSKLKKLGEINLESVVVDEYFAIIDDRLAYSTKEKALEMAKNIGCDGMHEHEFQGKIWYMPCEKHQVDAGKNTKSPCWDGYQQKGYKMINGKRRPNCVKIKYEEENK